MADSTTYRERRERKADRLREWADKREAKASAAAQTTDQLAGMIPMGQPILVGHHSERRHRRHLDRIDAGMRSTVENGRKADEFRSRADNIERAAKRAIYSDDEDAAERLEAKIANLEAQRVTIKERNAAYRKEHRAELKAMSAYERDRALPFPSYVLTNLGGSISRSRKRLAEIEAGPRVTPDRIITARYAGSCADCGAQLDRGDTIRYSKASGARCEVCPTTA